jgi:hypothetical protein
MAFTSFYQVEILTNGIISIYLVIVKMLQGESNKIIIFENVMLVYLRLYNFRIILNRSNVSILLLLMIHFLFTYCIQPSCLISPTKS